MSVTSAVDTAVKSRVTHDQESILLGAVEVFNRHGYDATSMGLLAENLGITKSAIYHHVPSKEYLLELALDRALGGLEGVLADPLATTSPAVSRLDFVLRAATEVLTDRLPYVTLLLRLRGNTELERAALERRRTFNRAVAELVDEAQADGAIRSDVDSRAITRLLFGMINSVVDWYRPDGRVSAAKVADDIVAVAFGGIRN
ncbi:MAG: TetR family transcriptional regulator [Cryobacterium sp.]|nr:TetR family transcriptional regulator [Cryobacterium sp.]